jgi:hypothetical protein
VPVGSRNVARVGEFPGVRPGGQHLGQERLQRRDAARRERVEAGDKPLVVVREHTGAPDREHARRVADAQHPAPGELVVHVAGERRHVGDVGEMGLVVEHGLTEVRDRPAQRDVDAEHLAELRRGQAGVRVPPGAERHEQFSRLAESE